MTTEQNGTKQNRIEFILLFEYFIMELNKITTPSFENWTSYLGGHLHYCVICIKKTIILLHQLIFWNNSGYNMHTFLFSFHDWWQHPLSCMDVLV